MTCQLLIECLDCGECSEASPILARCPKCGGEWLQARYDLAGLEPPLLERARRRPFDLWRYQEVLPYCSGRPPLSMGEGGTPLVKADNLGMMLRLENLYIKDERQGPTASFKDRQAAVTMAVLKEQGQTEAVVASTGNVGIAFSAYGARAGIKIWAFLTSLVPAAKMHEIALYGTQVVKVTSTYDRAKELAAEFARQRGLYLDRGARSIAAVEAMKSLAYEISEQLGAIADPEVANWASPDYYFQAVSGGIGPVGVLKGFQELKGAGLIKRVPALGIIQTEGCSPMVRAWRAGAESVEPIENPSTHISTLSTGDPGRVYSLLRRGMKAESGGLMESVSDEEAFRAMHLLAKLEGLSVEPAAAVAFAGLLKLVQAGQIEREAVIVVNCSGHTLPIEEEILGESWSQEIDLAPGRLPASPREGLISALARLDQRRTRDILIVDDHADARRLIRRVLQAQGQYKIREVSSGEEALEEARTSPPDLIVLDLMMPAMDGFAVLDELRSVPETEHIPVIVVTAKNLTAEEMDWLQSRISRVMLKGDFLTDDLIDEIVSALE